jgi:beta-lactamase superfamily II metal-dependent hydrolase
VTTDKPPQADEFELSLFGPGRGECIITHIGDGQWAVVDSCLNPGTKQPIALSYLQSIGVNVADSVCWVVVTHWHDDHMEGAAALLEAATNARFCCSIALTKDEFVRVVAQANQLMANSSDVAEIDNIFRILKDRKASRSTTPFGSLKFAQEDTRLFQRLGGSAPVELWSLSPSAASITRSLQEFSKMVPDTNSAKVHLPRQKANDVAAALLLRAGEIRVLLGSDLQSDTASDRGWRAVLTSTARPQEPAHIFKVPHHGSRNGHHPDVWRLMLEESPVAVIAPFASGGEPLPRKADQQRIVGLTKSAYCTAPSQGWSAPRKGQPVDRVLQARKLRAIDPKVIGHIRVRRRFQGEPDFRIELFNGAYQLS